MVMGKGAKDHIPYCEDQGIPNLCGAYARGESVQIAIFAMVTAPDDFVFADNGLSNMANTTYVVIPQNQTDSTKPATATSKAVTGFTLTGPAIGDVVDLVIMGKLAGQP